MIESVKTASDIYAPISGTIVAVNENLEDSPEIINENPYDDGWIFEMEVTDKEELSDLLSAEEYRNSIADEENE